MSINSLKLILKIPFNTGKIISVIVKYFKLK